MADEDRLFEAAQELGQLAGWTVPPDTADPYVVTLAYEMAVFRCGCREDARRIRAAMKVIDHE